MSMRQASSAMSWVAEPKPIITVAKAITTRPSAGDAEAASRIAAITISWANNIQDRRRPRSVSRNGKGSRSTNGAQMNFKV